jgi:hypothetical protein
MKICCFNFRLSLNYHCCRLILESASFSAEPGVRNPHVLRVLWGDRDFRDGTEIRGIREKIDKGVGKTGGISDFRRKLGLTKGY